MYNSDSDPHTNIFDTVTLETWSSASTNATADDLPGPGRLLGKLYNYLGKHLENGLGAAQPTDADDISYITCTTGSSNDTADNLDGPGRLLGNLYVSLGARLERKLGSIANRFGHGPHAVAVRIRKRRGAVIAASADQNSLLALSPTSIKAKSRKIERDCRRLINYTRHSTVETREQALEYILQFSTDDHYIRNLLRTLSAGGILEPSSWIDCEFSPSMRSMKALISLGDVELNGLAQNIQCIFVSRPVNFDGDYGLDALVERLMQFTRDPEHSFLAVRYIMQLSGSYEVSFSGRNSKWRNWMQNFLDMAVADSVEWERCDRFFEQWLVWVVSGEPQPSPGMLQTILHFANNLPRTTSSSIFQWFIAFDMSKDVDKYSHSYLTYWLLRDIARLNGVEGVEVYQISPQQLWDACPHCFLSPLLQRLMCTPDIILCQILLERRQAPFVHDDDYHELDAFVIHPDRLRHLCRELASYVDSANDLWRERAMRAVEILLVIDIYCRDAIMKALVSTRLASSSLYSELIGKTGETCEPSASERPFFNTAVLQSTDEGVLSCDSKGYPQYKSTDNGTEGISQLGLDFCTSHVLIHRVLQGTNLSIADYHGLFAGTTIDGKNAYIASSFTGLTHFGAVTDGLDPADLRLGLRELGIKRVEVPECIDIYVLRYAPDTYMRLKTMKKTWPRDISGHRAPYTWRPLTKSELYDNPYNCTTSWTMYDGDTENRLEELEWVSRV